LAELVIALIGLYPHLWRAHLDSDALSGCGPNEVVGYVSG